MQDKKKILFIVAEFWQAGGERQTFEIINNLINENIDIEILSLRALNSDKSKDDYYYQKYIDLKIKIHFLDNIPINYKPKIKERVLNKLSIKKLPSPNHLLIDFFSPYERVFFMGEYTLPVIERFLTNSILEKTYVFIQFSVFQVPDNYLKYDKNKCYKFISGFNETEILTELSEFTGYKHFFFPLSITLEKKAVYSNWNNGIKRIGLFTRITVNKPLDVFFYALHVMLCEGEKIELHIFGDCSENMQIIENCLAYLNIKNYVFFHGHQLNMTQAAIDYKIDLVWFHSYYGAPGGYASFDLSNIGVPQLFWNFTPSFDISSQSNSWPIFNNLKEFILETKKKLMNDKERIELSNIQNNSVRKDRNIENHIGTIKKIVFDPISH
jgi:hypothetical protein